MAFTLVSDDKEAALQLLIKIETSDDCQSQPTAAQAVYGYQNGKVWTWIGWEWNPASINFAAECQKAVCASQAANS